MLAPTLPSIKKAALRLVFAKDFPLPLTDEALVWAASGLLSAASSRSNFPVLSGGIKSDAWRTGLGFYGDDGGNADADMSDAHQQEQEREGYSALVLDDEQVYAEGCEEVFSNLDALHYPGTLIPRFFARLVQVCLPYFLSP
jgi:hypothetical protein